MGQADYKAITPPHSIINILDFYGPKHLAAYLKQLIKNETEYLSYFSWQHLYKEKKISNPWCKLCQMLNNQELPNKNYKNLYKWWSVDSHCKAKGTYSWSKYASPTKSLWGELSAYKCILTRKLMEMVVTYHIIHKPKQKANQYIRLHPSLALYPDPFHSHSPTLTLPYTYHCNLLL